MEPEPPLPFAAAPPPENDEKEAQAAKRKLMLLVRSHPQVMQALQLRKRADDTAIMKALGKFNNLFEILRLAGCSIPEASKAEALWELAIQAPPVKRRKKSNAWIWYSSGGVVAFTILIFVAVIVLQLTQATQGYEVGSCYISLFTNSTCLQGTGMCLMEVAVRSGDLFLVKSGWPLPVEHTGSNGDFTTYFGDPFRCCNDEEGRVPSCCDLVSGGVQQRTAETFCDSWGSIGKTDWTGQACPIGAWPCLFTVVQGGPTGDMVDELMYFAQPDVSSYIFVVGGLLVLLVLLLLAPLFKKYCKCDCDLNLMQEEEAAELYDPDDPNSDWGQEVQEALKDEYQRKQGGGFSNKLTTLIPQLHKVQQLRRMLSVLCARCRRKTPGATSDEAPLRSSKELRRSGSKISQGRGSRASRGSKSPAAPMDQAPVMEDPTVSRTSQSQDPTVSRTSQSQDPTVSRTSQSQASHSILRSSTMTMGPAPNRSSQVPRTSQAAHLVEPQTSEDDGKAPSAPVVNVPLPPGFICESHDVQHIKKYQKWDSQDKDVTTFGENDIHPGFQLGNLSSLARLAQQQKEDLCAPIIEPMPKTSGRQKRRFKKPRHGDPKSMIDGLVHEKGMFRKLQVFQPQQVRGSQRSASPMLE